MVASKGYLLPAKGTDVASASSITLGKGTFFLVTGTTNVDTIVTTGWTAGDTIVLTFDNNLTMNNNAGNLHLAGDFATSTDYTLTLVFNGTNWVETGRTSYVAP